MSTFEPPPTEPALNPYAAPDVEIGGPAISLTGDLAQAEAIRRTHINHEASIKAFGWLSMLGGILGVIAAPFLIAVGSGAFSLPGNEPLGGQAALGIGVLFLVLGLVNILVGNGMRRLQPWARWTETALMSMQVLLYLAQVNVFGVLISAYILYLMLSAKGALVFSPRYKEVIALTPHIKYKTSRLVKILLAVLLTVLGLLITLAIIAGLRG